MNIADLFIRRPIMTSLVMIAILIFGVVSYQLLPVNDLPNVDFPTIQVNASLPGANPDTMASAVATPLENQLSTIAGVDSMTSTNGVGTTQDHPPVQPGPRYRCRCPGCAGGHIPGDPLSCRKTCRPRPLSAR